MKGFFMRNSMTDRRTGHPLVAIVFSLLILGCSNGNIRDVEMENSLAKALNGFKNNKDLYMELNPIIGKEWRRVCIQRPYMEEALFEHAVAEREVTDYEYIVDDMNIFWVFYANGTYRWIKIPRTLMDEHPNMGTPCTGMDNPKLYGKFHSYSGNGYGSKKFFLAKN